MIAQHSNVLALPTVRLILGICAVILSLIYSIQFISDGSSGIGIIPAVVFCVITEFCKVTFTTDLAYYNLLKSYDKLTRIQTITKIKIHFGQEAVSAFFKQTIPNPNV